MLHISDSHIMHPHDPIVIFKTNNMSYPNSGRLRRFKKKGNSCEASYIYIYNLDGEIFEKYSEGTDILEKIEFKDKILLKKITNF